MNQPGHFGHVKSISTYTYARARARVYVLIHSSCPKCPGIDRRHPEIPEILDCTWATLKNALAEGWVKSFRRPKSRPFPNHALACGGFSWGGMTMTIRSCE